jgi:NAD(P)-dependent dehydrogenase (short-subunit alcohol dehydrogenase family)
MMEDLAVERIGLPPDALAGQVAVVTGGGQGIGREVAVAFAKLGASVVVADTSAAGQETERLIRKGGGRVLFVRADVSDEADVARLARRTQEVFGPAEVLINAAAACPVASVQDLDVALWDRAIAVNLRGTFLTCKAFLPQMLARQRGIIVNVISTDATRFLSAYVASREGVAGFSQSLAVEVGPEGVRVIALAAGVVDAPGLGTAARGLGTAARGLATPADQVAAAIAYLVVALADEYHGEQVDVPTVLARAGLGVGPGADLQTVAPVAEPAPASSAGRTGALQQALMMSERLQGVIAETAAEFGQLPDFVRPLVRDGFESKAGQCIEDWSLIALELTERLKQMAAADATVGIAFSADYSRLKPMFDGLMRYYHEALSEPACFTTHTEGVAQVRQTMRERESVVRSLLGILEMIQ